VAQRTCVVVFVPMNVSIPLLVAVIGGVVTLCGAVVSNALDRKKALIQQKIEFRYEQYKEFLASFCELASNPGREAQLRFSKASNGVLLLAGEGAVRSITNLVLNYQNPIGDVETQQEILEQTIFHMRSDLEAPDQKKLKGYRFPFVVPDIPENDKEHSNE
jgi:hypothetical protein